MRIAIVDYEPSRSQFISGLLEEAGVSVWTFGSAASFQRIADRETFDMALVAWPGPAGDGDLALGRIRAAAWASAPVFLIANPQDEALALDGLEAGADDYLLMPMAPQILRARVMAALRRVAPAPATEVMRAWVVAGFTIDPFSRTVTADGEPANLTAKEFALAALLFANVGRPLSRSYLIEAIWSRNPDLPTRTLDAHVYRLRNKLNLRPERGFRLAPVYGYGYRLDIAEGAAAISLADGGSDMPAAARRR